MSLKFEKTAISGLFPFLQAGKNFFEENGLQHLFGSTDAHLCAKNYKKLMIKSRENPKKPLLGGVKSFLGGLNSPRGDFTPVLRTGVKFFLRIFFANFCRFLHVYTISFFTPGWKKMCVYFRFILQSCKVFRAKVLASEFTHILHAFLQNIYILVLRMFIFSLLFLWYLSVF